MRRIETGAALPATALLPGPQADFKLLTFISVFVGMLVGMNLLGGKVVSIFGVSAV